MGENGKMEGCTEENQPIVLRTMGSFAFGGDVYVKENGETVHRDHGYAQYFVPWDATDYPVIFWHGMGQSGRSWETTPDGRDGFWQIFTKKNIPVYLIDQCRRGRAGYTNVPLDPQNYNPVKEHESDVWKNFRNGVWLPPEPATVFEGSQFPATPSGIEQFMRMQTPDTGDEPLGEEHNYFMANMMKDLLEQAGPSILFVFSQSGKYGWASVLEAPDLVKGVVTYEPGHYFFPDDFEVPRLDSPLGDYINMIMRQYTVPKAEWMKLTKIPIRIYYGDFIMDQPSDIFGNEVWRFSTIFAGMFTDLINMHGGDAKLVKLPEIGITGNGHGFMMEKNNAQIADLIIKDLWEAGLGGNDKPYRGPRLKQLTNYTIPIDLQAARDEK